MINILAVIHHQHEEGYVLYLVEMEDTGLKNIPQQKIDVKFFTLKLKPIIIYLPKLYAKKYFNIHLHCSCPTNIKRQIHSSQFIVTGLDRLMKQINIPVHSKHPGYCNLI